MANDKPAKSLVHPLQELAAALFAAPVPAARPGREEEAPLRFTERGAALFLAFVSADSPDVAKMTPAIAIDAAVLWRRMHVQCWQAMRLGDTVRMSMFSKALGKPRDERALRAEVDAILAPAKTLPKASVAA